MTDILRRLHCTIRCDIETAESGCHCAEGRDTITALRAEVEKLKAAYSATQHDIQQTLGKALRYPWFKDDQKNFPNATEADGVCVGDHVAESLADEAAAKITALRAEVERLKVENEAVLSANRDVMLHWDVLKADYEKLRAALKEIAGYRMKGRSDADIARAALGDTP